jgi:anti-sigma regulatory factor (Ser/Thr protein kinase)
MLRLRSNPTLFSAVRGAVEHLSEALGFPESQCSSITRAVDEALTNIARHSYNNRLEQPITVYFLTTQRDHHGKVQQGLEILLCDRGPAVDSSKLHGRPLGEIRPGGLGLHFMRQAMDTVEFMRKGSTNRTRLVKYLIQTQDTP